MKAKKKTKTAKATKFADFPFDWEDDNGGWKRAEYRTNIDGISETIRFAQTPDGGILVRTGKKLALLGMLYPLLRAYRDDAKLAKAIDSQWSAFSVSRAARPKRGASSASASGILQNVLLTALSSNPELLKTLAKNLG